MISAGAEAAWAATNYLSVAQLYLEDNVLLERALEPRDLKRRVVGHWGTAPGMNGILVHLSWLARAEGLSILPIIGTGHAASSMLAWLYLEGTLGEFYPDLRWSRDGLGRLVAGFGTGGLFRTELSAHLPGVFAAHGELGPALSVAQAIALDQEEILVACVVGDGELETGPAAASLLATRELSAQGARAPLLVVNLNGLRMGATSILGRMHDDELRRYFAGFGYTPFLAGLDDHSTTHQLFRQARSEPGPAVVIVRSEKGATFPSVGGRFSNLAGTPRSHKAPLHRPAEDPEEFAILEQWLASYEPHRLFSAEGAPTAIVREVLPERVRRLGRQWLALPPARPLKLPDPATFSRGSEASPMATVESYLDAVLSDPQNRDRLRIFSPDELASNRLGKVRQNHPDRVVEVLSEDVCHGWTEGYTRSGRHALLVSYEAFASRFAGAFAQSLKFELEAREVAFRPDGPSLNYLLTSLGWHNVYSHQNPDFLSLVLLRESDLTRVFLPVNDRRLVAQLHAALTSSRRINLLVASKYDLDVQLTAKTEEALASQGAAMVGTPVAEPDLILAAAGDVACACVLRAAEKLAAPPHRLVTRVVLVEQPQRLSPRQSDGFAAAEYRALFGDDQPILFSFTGYAATIRALLAGRPNADLIEVVGYQDQTGHDFESNLQANQVAPEQLVRLGLERVQQRTGQRP